MTADNTIKLFRLDDCDTWVGTDLQSVVAAAKAQCGEDCYDDADVQYELSEEEMRQRILECEDGAWRTYRQELDRMIVAGERFPCIFCSSER